MEKLKLTDLEKEVMLIVLTSDYQCFDKSLSEIDFLQIDKLIGSAVWYIDQNDTKYPMTQIRGAISSCVKKGFIHVVQDGNDSTICLYVKGLKALAENNIDLKYYI